MDVYFFELFVLSIIFLLLLLALRGVFRFYFKAKTRMWIFEGPFMSHYIFEQKWLGDKGAKNGLKHQDCSGCYVILIYPPTFDGESFEDFDNVYVGQSINIHQRVYDHLHGKGCSYLPNDLANGNSIWFRFVPCKRSEMNHYEKQIIWALNATQSYNQTRGGSKRQ